VYAPADGVYSFYYCNFSEDDAGLGWPEEKRRVWKFECFSSQDPQYLTVDGWKRGNIFSIPMGQDVAILQCDAGNVDEVIFIEKKFLQPVPGPYVANKWNIPLKACRIVEKSTNILREAPANTIPWCEAHGYGVAPDKKRCQEAIPRDYIPCYIQGDQAGDFCHTHNIMDGENLCEDYKGPRIPRSDPWGMDEIPVSYQTCHLDVDRRQCYTHHNGICTNANSPARFPKSPKIIEVVE